MKNLALTLFTLIWIGVAAVAVAQRDIPQMAGDPSCSAGEAKFWANTTTHKIRKCQNGTISDVDSAAAATGTTYFGVNGDEYSPDRKPDDSALYLPCSDEFNGASTGTWTWANQGTATWTVNSGVDYAILSSPNQVRSTRGLYCVPDNSANWTFTAKLTFGVRSITSLSSVFGGLWVVDGGTVGAPTNVVGVFIEEAPGFNTGTNVWFSTRTGYTGGWTSGNATNELLGTGGNFSNAMSLTTCLQLRYVVATKVLTAKYAADCRNFALLWITTPTRTLAAAPPALGFFVDPNGNDISTMLIEWVRFRTDSTGNSGMYLPGS
jgi:hypothetical protein